MEKGLTTSIKEISSVGEVLQKELKHLGVTQKQFAEVIGMSASHLNEIIRGHREISLKIAEKFQAALSIPAPFWVDLQTNYNIATKNVAKDDDEREYRDLLAEYDTIISVKDILRKQLLSNRSSKEKVDVLMNEYGLPNPSELRQEARKVGGLFRKSDKRGLDERMIATWIVLAKHEASKENVSGTFNKDSMPALSKELRNVFHENSNTLKKVTNILSEFGIRFCVVDKLDHASIDGFSFIEDNIPTIVVTLRHKRIDNLAFGVLHEVFHVYKHLNEDMSSMVSIGDYDNESKEEKDANDFAANTLIPLSMWEMAPSVPMNPYIIQHKYSEWANRYGLNKWIVLGRVSYETGMYKFKADSSRLIN